MKSRIFTVPNQLTFLRLGFLPLFIILIFYRHYSWALAVLLVSGLTDTFDGVLARSLNQRTALGAYLDPIADKLLLSSSFVVLALEGQVRWWLTILVLGRDVLILTTATVILLTAFRISEVPAVDLLRQDRDDAPDGFGVCRAYRSGLSPSRARCHKTNAGLSRCGVHGIFRLSL